MKKQHQQQGEIMELTSISEIARRLGIPPRLISDLFYARKLDERRCPLVGNRRVIPLDYLPEIEAALRKAGYLSTEAF